METETAVDVAKILKLLFSLFFSSALFLCFHGVTTALRFWTHASGRRRSPTIDFSVISFTCDFDMESAPLHPLFCLFSPVLLKLSHTISASQPVSSQPVQFLSPYRYQRGGRGILSKEKTRKSHAFGYWVLDRSRLSFDRICKRWRSLPWSFGGMEGGFALPFFLRIVVLLF